MVKSVVQKLFKLFRRKCYSEQTGFMLNLLTLKIDNAEIAQNFQKHQANKLDRLLWGGIAASIAFVVSTSLNAFAYKKGPRVLVLCNALLMVLVVAFKAFRSKFPNKT